MQIKSIVSGLKISIIDQNYVGNYAFEWGYALVNILLHPKAIFVMTRLLKKVMNR